MKVLKKSIQEACAGTMRIVSRLRSLTTKDDVISYHELSQVSGKDVRGKGRYMLDTARRILRREGMSFGTVINAGIRRLSDEETVDLGPVFLRQTRKAAKRRSEKLACIQNFNSLSSEKKVSYLSNQTILHFFAEAGGQKTVRQIENAVRVSQKQLPFSATLAVFAQQDESK